MTLSKSVCLPGGDSAHFLCHRQRTLVFIPNSYLSRYCLRMIFSVCITSINWSFFKIFKSTFDTSIKYPQLATLRYLHEKHDHFLQSERGLETSNNLGNEIAPWCKTETLKFLDLSYFKTLYFCLLINAVILGWMINFHNSHFCFLDVFFISMFLGGEELAPTISL